MEIFHPKKIKKWSIFSTKILYTMLHWIFIFFVLVAAEPKFTPKNKNHLLGDLAHLHKCREAGFNGNKGPMRWSHIQAPFLLSPGPRAFFTWHKNHCSSFIKHLPLYPEGAFTDTLRVSGKRTKNHLREFPKNVVAKLRLQCLLLLSSLEKKRKQNKVVRFSSLFSDHSLLNYHCVGAVVWPHVFKFVLLSLNYEPTTTTTYNFLVVVTRLIRKVRKTQHQNLEFGHKEG